MRRKVFIRNMSFIGAGLSLAPWNLATANSSIQRFRLPPASVHIPHGNFATAEIEKLTISEFDLECSTQVFMRNGIEQCDDDLTICSFQRADELLTVCFTANGKPLTQGQIKGLEVGIHALDRDSFTVRKA